jgi:hypothetical protein
MELLSTHVYPVCCTRSLLSTNIILSILFSLNLCPYPNVTVQLSLSYKRAGNTLSYTYFLHLKISLETVDIERNDSKEPPYSICW